MSKERALNMLRKSINMPAATFREGQWEAIEKLTINKEKLLVIQRTGWGKSSVYFISSKILREQGRGPTIIISPLLALMRNQIEAAERLGIKAVQEIDNDIFEINFNGDSIHEKFNSVSSRMHMKSNPQSFLIDLPDYGERYMEKIN